MIDEGKDKKYESRDFRKELKIDCIMILVS